VACACGWAGVGQARAARHPCDVELTCGSCGRPIVVALAGIGPLADIQEPDAPPVESEPEWRNERRRAVLGTSRRLGDPGFSRDLDAAA
jgi:hypothetical protein